MKIILNLISIFLGFFILSFFPKFIEIHIINLNKQFLYLFFKNFYKIKIDGEIEIESFKILIDKKCTFLIPFLLLFPILLLNSKFFKIFFFSFLIIFLSISRQIFEVFFIVEFNFYSTVFSDLQNIFLPSIIYLIFIKKFIQQPKLFQIEQQ
jgi:hypothetical protein